MVRTVAIQIETTGFSKDTDRITEIYAIAMDDGEPTETPFHTFVNPHQPLSEGAKKQNRIAQRDIDKAPDFSEIADKFADYIEDATPVFFVPHFSRGFLRHEIELLSSAQRASFKPEQNKTLDSLLEKGNFINVIALAKSFVKQSNGSPLPQYRMQDIALTLKVDHHLKAVKRCNAAIDCQTLVKIYGEIEKIRSTQAPATLQATALVSHVSTSSEVKLSESPQRLLYSGIMTRAKRRAMESQLEKHSAKVAKEELATSAPSF